jgi:uncharacterized membrane protein
VSPALVAGALKPPNRSISELEEFTREAKPMTSRIARLGRRSVLVLGLIAVPGLMVPIVPNAGAADGKDTRTETRAWTDRPERGLSMYTEYSQLTVPVGDTVRMDLTVEDKGKKDENVTVRIVSAPKGWKASIKGGQFTVNGVPVTPEKPRVLTFTAEPDKGLRPGTYTFQVEAMTSDRAFTVAQPVTVTTEVRKASAAGDLQITTSYPVLRGPTDSSFEFSLEVNNKTDADRIVNVAAEAPKGWDVNVKPGYESKQITSLRIRANSNQTVALEVKPPRDAQAGDYPLTFRASTDTAQGETKLRVVLTGIYKLDATTPTGRLSLDAVVGRPTTTTLLVKNTGSAPNKNVKLTSFAPESWKVEFSPETIESLDPGGIKQVEAKITPAGQALVGDYSVSLTADGEKASKSVEMRVTVHAPATWGWIGVAMIAVVIGGLGGLFTWLGRR